MQNLLRWHMLHGPAIPPAHLRIISTAVPTNLPLCLLCLPTTHDGNACHSMAHGIISSLPESFSQLFSPFSTRAKE